MRIKVGNVWYEAQENQPIMIELTTKDKENIRNMHPDATKYAIFPDSKMTTDEKLGWME